MTEPTDFYGSGNMTLPDATVEPQFSPQVSPNPYGGGDMTPPKAPPKDILKTSFKTTGGTERGDPVPWSSSPEFPGATPDAGPQFVSGVKGAISGDTSVLHPEIPALNIHDLGLTPLDAKAWGLVGNMALSRNPDALARVIRERLPDAKIDWDQKNEQGKPADGARLTVQMPGGPQMYLDRPGFTPQKALFYGPQTLAAVASGGRSIIAQMGLSGLQHALSQLGSYALGGEEKPIDPAGTAIATLAPGVLSAVGAGAIKGYDWLTSEASSSAEAIAARAKALYNWGFAGKEGDITQNPATLAKEDLATNAGSDAARLHMQSFHDFNVDRNQANKRQIVGGVSGDIAPGQPVPPAYQPYESAFGDRLNAAITGKVKDLTDAEDTAWKNLGDVSPSTAAGRSVTFSPDVSTDVLAGGSDVLRKFYGAPQGPNGTYTAAQLGKTGQAAVDAFGQVRQVMQPAAADGSPGAIQGFNLGHLQDLRQQLGNVIKDNPGSPAAAAAAQMKRQLDDTITAAETTPGRMGGNQQALTDFRNANAATRARYDFMEPRDNPAAERLISGVTNGAAPNTGQQTINGVFGGTGGTVTPGGGTSAIIPHLQVHLGADAMEPLGGALAMRSLYGNKAASEVAEGPTARPLFDFNSTSDRIKSQLLGQGRDVSTQVLPPDAQQTLLDYSRALDVLGTANRAGAPRLNAPGSGYIGMMTRELPFGLGRIVDKALSNRAAQNATQTGAEIMQKAAGGANTEAGLGIKLPRQSTLNDPNNPFFSWQPGAWRAGTPIYRGGGLLLGEDANQGR